MRAEDFVGLELTGRVRRFAGDYGFVVSDAFEGDLFFSKRSNRHLPDAAFKEGLDVGFTVNLTNAGKPEARKVQVLGDGLHASVTPIQVEPVFEDMGAGSECRPEDLVGHQLMGRIRRFRGSFGFVVSESFEGDLLVGVRGNRHLPETAFREGACVQFEVAQMGSKPEAVNVVVLGDQTATAPFVSSLPGTLANIVQGTTPLGALFGQRVAGVVKSYRDGWGFLISEQFEGDLFFHAGHNVDIEDVMVGDRVEVTVAPDDRAVNGARARDAAYAKVEQSALCGRRCSGWIKQFANGWGFICSERFEGSLFIGTKEGLNPELNRSLSTGDRVTFDIATDASGKFRAARTRVSNPLVVESHQLALAFPQPVAVPVIAGGAPMITRCNGWLKGFQGEYAVINSNCFAGDLLVGTRGNPQMQSLRPGNLVEFDMQIAGGQMAIGNIGVPNLDDQMLAVAGVSNNPHAGTRKRSRTPPRGASDGTNADQSAQLLMVGRTLFGWVKSFQDSSGCLRSVAFPGDLFISLARNPRVFSFQLVAKQPVKFEIQKGPSGKPEAINVELV